MSECYPLTPSDFLFEADDQGSCWRGMAARWTTCGAAAVRALGGGMCWFCGTCWGTFPRHGVLCVLLSIGALSLDMVFYVLFCHLLCGFEILSALILPCVIMVDYGMEGVYLTPHTSCIVYFHLMFCGKKYSLVESPAFCSKILANCILHMVLHNGNISELHLTHCVLLCYVFLR